MKILLVDDHPLFLGGHRNLLTAHSIMVLVRFALTSHRALLLSGEQFTVLTADDLVQIIERS